MNPLDSALALYDAGHFEESLSLFRLALDQHPDQHDLVCDLACLEFSCGWVAQARRRLSAALERWPESPRLQVDLARIAQAQGRFRTALNYLDGGSPCRLLDGLKARLLDRLNRPGEAFQAWQRFLAGPAEPTWLQAEEPLRGYSRIPGIVLMDREEEFLACGEADVSHVGELLRGFLVLREVFGWPLTSVVALEEEALGLARAIAGELDIPCRVEAELLESDFFLAVAVRATELRVDRLPRARVLTLCLAELGRADYPYQTPDVSGCRDGLSIDWQGLGPDQVADRLREQLRRSPDDRVLAEFWLENHNLRPHLHPTPGAGNRVQNFPRVDAAELCRRLRNGDLEAVRWVQKWELYSAEAAAAAWEVLPGAAGHQRNCLASLIMRSPGCDWRRLWEEVPGSRYELMYVSAEWERHEFEELLERGLCSGPGDLLEAAIHGCWQEGVSPGPLALEALESETSNYLTGPVLLRARGLQAYSLEGDYGPSLLCAQLAAVREGDDQSRLDQVRPLLRHSCQEVRAEAALTVGHFRDCESVPDLVVLAGDSHWRLARAALTALAQIGGPLAEAAALAVLPRHPRYALEALLALGSSAALEAARQLSRQRRNCPHKACARYLERFGEAHEDMLETLLASGMLGYLAAAKALWSRGDWLAREVFECALSGGDWMADEAVEELRLWGTAEALELLATSQLDDG